MSNLIDEEQSPQIVVIGGGPVGLFTAIQIKILLPQVNLVIYEKHQQYERNHILRLNKMRTFFGLPPSLLLKNMIDNLPSVVRTSVLESQLLELSKQLQIPIVHRNIENLNQFSDSRVIIGADGSHSIVLQLVFNNKMEYEKVLKYVIEIKYEVNGQGQKLDFIKYQYRTQKQLKYLVDEHIGTQKENRTPITLHLLIDKQIYEQMKSATFKQPYYLHSHQHLIPKDLLETITIWFNVKKDYANEQRIENSEKITCITLAVYQSSEFVYYNEEKKQYTCLVGDAAFGVPFFRSLNNGIMCSKKLSLCIHSCFREYSSQTYRSGHLLTNLKFALKKAKNELHYLINWNKPLNAYNQYVHALANVEVIFAEKKAALLFVIEVMNKITGTVPWQVNKWSSSKVEKFKQTKNDNNESEIIMNDDVDTMEMDDENYELVQEFDLVT
ncbi:unnamed protein product [Rotaria sp. Silwood2]|nr:unnamed protein product [Rotaria sp. Silwood2]